MSEQKHFVMTALGAVLLLIVGGVLLVWPSYREAAAMRQGTAELNQRVATLETRQAEVQQLDEELAEARRLIREELKVIPEAADIAELMRRLSLRVDGVAVQDQTFTAGAPFGALPDEKYRTQALPLTIDMMARFDSAFAVLRAAETLDRLIRISSVRISCDREKTVDQDQPFVTASIVMEAIYEPPMTTEGQ